MNIKEDDWKIVKIYKQLLLDKLRVESLGRVMGIFKLFKERNPLITLK